MTYKITIDKLEEKKEGDYNRRGETIYEQIADDINLVDVINAFNGNELYKKKTNE